jgi:glycosyltransferase involved in cell wall biosynthesis
MTARPAIVVLTPLKNDAWILRRFLEVTSVFADRIVIADQGSTDGGLEICREFPKVILVDNSDRHYDEASRQQLLIAAGRGAAPLPRILMALDTDEILAANAIESAGWQRMLEAPPATVVMFEKPNLYLTPDRCERRPLDFPGAFVDDGVTAHHALRIHSPRIPMPDGARRLILEDVKFLHYALVRPEAQKAKMRMYAALENVMGTKSLYRRRRYYSSSRVLSAMGPIEPTPREWYAAWEARGIDMRTIEDVQPYWQDLAVLDLLLRHGARRFWLDDIWARDWNALLRREGRAERITPPPRILRAALGAAQRAVEAAAAARRRIGAPKIP